MGLWCQFNLNQFDILAPLETKIERILINSPDWTLDTGIESFKIFSSGRHKLDLETFRTTCGHGFESHLHSLLSHQVFHKVPNAVPFCKLCFAHIYLSIEPKYT